MSILHREPIEPLRGFAAFRNEVENVWIRAVGWCLRQPSNLNRMMARWDVDYQERLDKRYALGCYDAYIRDPELVVCVITTHAACQTALETLLNPDLGDLTIGFDLEWGQRDQRGVPKRARLHHVDLVQIAMEGRIYLIHLASFGMTTGPRNLPANLITVLENEKIRKVGNNIRGDAIRLGKSHAVNVLNCCDISYMARRVDRSAWPLSVSLFGRFMNRRYWLKPPNYNGIDTRSLQRLVFHYFGLILSKEERMAEWQYELTADMQQYAVNDAHASLSLYRHLSAFPGFQGRSESCHSISFIDGIAWNVLTTDGDTQMNSRTLWEMPKEMLSD